MNPLLSPQPRTSIDGIRPFSLIVHVSSPSAAAHLRDAQTRGLPVYAETCPQYLFLTRADLDGPNFEGAKCVCSPPPRDSPDDHEAIWRGLANGTFTILSSDHCPFRFEDSASGKKSAISSEYPEGRFSAIPNGCPGIETRLAVILNANQLQLQKFVEVTSTNAAKLYGLYPQKGAIIPGLSDADLVIWYPPDRLEPFKVTTTCSTITLIIPPSKGWRCVNGPGILFSGGRWFGIAIMGAYRSQKAWASSSREAKVHYPDPREKKNGTSASFECAIQRDVGSRYNPPMIKL